MSCWYVVWDFIDDYVSVFKWILAVRSTLEDSPDLRYSYSSYGCEHRSLGGHRKLRSAPNNASLCEGRTFFFFNDALFP